MLPGHRPNERSPQPVSALFGLEVAIVTPSTTALVADLVKAGHMGSAMGVFGTIWDTGEAFGPILAGFLIASMDYSPAFTLIGLLMAVAALFFAVFVSDPQWARGHEHLVTPRRQEDA